MRNEMKEPLPCIDCYTAGKCGCDDCKNETCALCGGSGYTSMVTPEDLASELFRLKNQNDLMKELLKTIYETDCLPDWAYDKGDEEESIAESLKRILEK